MEENVNMCAFILQLPSSQRSDVRVPVSWDGRVVILVHAHFVFSSMPWLRQMLCSTQQARMIWQTFSGAYSSLPADASKHRHLPFTMPMLRSPTDRARACAVLKWASSAVRNRGEKGLTSVTCWRRND